MDSDGNPAPDKRQPCFPFQSRSKSRRENVWTAADESQKPAGEPRHKAPTNRCPEKRIEIIFPDALSLPLVKIPPVRQVIEGGRQEADFHALPFRNFVLAWSQSKSVSLPRTRRSDVSRKAPACQAGDSNSASSRLRSAHKVSMSFSFSRRGIRWISSGLMLQT